jgi:hypothetical protein
MNEPESHPQKPVIDANKIRTALTAFPIPLAVRKVDSSPFDSHQNHRLMNVSLNVKLVLGSRLDVRRYEENRSVESISRVPEDDRIDSTIAVDDLATGPSGVGLKGG